MNTIIKGDQLMLFDNNGESIALATSHTMNITASAAEVNCKDGGIWTSSTVNQMGWTITSENLYSTTEYDRLFDILTARQPVTVYFGLKSQTGNGDVDTSGAVPSGGDATSQKVWTKAATGTYTGQAVITSLDVNAASGDNATFTCTLQGVGAITRQTGE